MKIKPRLKEELKKYLIKKEAEDEKRVTVTAPYRLGQKELSQIVSLYPELKGKSIDQVVDTSLIAGVVIKHGSKVRDMSLKTQLISLEQQINEIA